MPINSIDLLEVNDYWLRDRADNRVEVLNLVAENDDVVASMSARFNIVESITIPDTNHESIAKPCSSSADVVIEVTKFITADKPLEKYKNIASQSYKEWRRFDRHHTLDYVADELRRVSYQLLCDAMDSPVPLVRLTGLSGLGKSRLLVEYINEFSLKEEQILVFDASKDAGGVLKSITDAVDDGVSGLVIIENCEVKLHDDLRKLFPCEDSKLHVVTVNFYHEVVANSTHIKLEKLQADEVLKLIKSILKDLKEDILLKIAKFVEGFPLLVDMVTSQLLQDGNISAHLSESDLVEKLINGDGNLEPKQRELLKVFSLFDCFQFQDDASTPSDVIDFICGIAEASRLEFDSTITKYKTREIVSYSEKYARVVPKPLALNLAMDWWNSSLFQRQNELISGLPPSLLDSFGRQIKYLDGSINVRSFVENFMGIGRPFGQAELLLSKKGSKLFRALVEVNPEATSNALSRVFQQLSNEDITNIDRDSRRELVWALEMLCWHRPYFEESAWCLLKLACYESESYSNNSTGQFSMLFRWRNCGTEANFEQRLSLLNRILSLDDERADIVTLEAIKEAISTHGGTRIIGSEHQGTKPEMQEWIPETWQQVFDYWGELFEMLLKLAKKPYATDLVKNMIGHEIRGLVSSGTIKMLDYAIRDLVSSQGKYWPAAAQSIIHALEYDSEKMPQEVKNALLGWQLLLAPDKNNLKEQLILIVLDPTREYEHDEKGELIDMAAQDAIGFANELDDLDALVLLFDFILTFHQQKQSWVFGKEIVKQMDSGTCDPFFSRLLETLSKCDGSRFEFVAGCLTGLNERDASLWADIVDRFLQKDELKSFYPDALRTGRFGLDRLMVVIELIREGHLTSQNAAFFGYGRVTEHLEEKELVQFCSALSEVDEPGVWVALDILNMYMFGREDYDFEALKPLLEQLLLSVSFRKEHKTRHHDGYHWLRNVEKILKNGEKAFALKLVDYLLDQVVNNDIEFSDLWDNFHPAFYGAFELCADEIWPSFSQNILDLSEPRSIYRLTELLGSGKESRRKTNSIFTLVDEELVVEWCAEEKALLMVARSLNLLNRSEDQCVPNSLLLRLIDRYGDNQYLNSEIRANYHSRSWSGSLVPYLEADKEALQPLKEHKSVVVRQWVEEFISMLDHEISENSKRDSENTFIRGW